MNVGKDAIFWGQEKDTTVPSDFVAKNKKLLTEINLGKPQKKGFEPIRMEEIDAIHHDIDSHNNYSLDSMKNYSTFAEYLEDYQHYGRPDRTIFDEVGFVTVCMLRNPIYYNGNTETAFMTGLYLLEKNGYKVKDYADLFNSIDISVIPKRPKMAYPEEACAKGRFRHVDDKKGNSFVEQLAQHSTYVGEKDSLKRYSNVEHNSDVEEDIER